MKLTNYTAISTDRLRAMIRFVCPSNVTGFHITFKNDGAGSLHGYAYHSGTAYHRDEHGKCPPLVTIHVPKGWKGLKGRCPGYKDPRVANPVYGRPVRYSSGRGYMTAECFTHEERMVNIIAHELRHLWQKRVPKGYRVWGARGRFSERDADAYAIRMTRAWRRRPNEGVRQAAPDLIK